MLEWLARTALFLRIARLSTYYFSLSFANARMRFGTLLYIHYKKRPHNKSLAFCNMPHFVRRSLSVYVIIASLALFILFSLFSAAAGSWRLSDGISFKVANDFEHTLYANVCARRRLIGYTMTHGAVRECRLVGSRVQCAREQRASVVLIGTGNKIEINHPAAPGQGRFACAFAIHSNNRALNH